MLNMRKLKIREGKRIAIVIQPVHHRTRTSFTHDVFNKCYIIDINFRYRFPVSGIVYSGKQNGQS